MADDPLAMEHPKYPGDTYAYSALDDAAGCAYKLLAILEEADGALTKEQEAVLIKQAVANGLGTLIHLTRALVYGMTGLGARIGDSMPYAGRGT